MGNFATFENTNNDEMVLRFQDGKNNPTAITADEAIKNALGEVSVTELTSIRNLLKRFFSCKCFNQIINSNP
jgi:hypothetical protein